MEYTIRTSRLPLFFKSMATNGIYVSRQFSLPTAVIDSLHYHDEVEIGVCFDGEGEIHIDDKIYHFQKGTISVVASGIPHFSRSFQYSSWRWIMFKPNVYFRSENFPFFSEDPTMLLRDHFPSGVFDADEYPELTSAVHHLIYEHDLNDEFCELTTIAALIHIIAICKRIQKSCPPDENSSGQLHSEYYTIRPALEYISANLDDTNGLSVANLASLCSISESTFRRLFHKHIGLSPKEFIIRSRMAYAEYLLRKTDLSILEISLYTGYHEISGFIRTFKEIFGTTPKKYRVQNT